MPSGMDTHTHQLSVQKQLQEIRHSSDLKFTTKITIYYICFNKLKTFYGPQVKHFSNEFMIQTLYVSKHIIYNICNFIIQNHLFYQNIE